MPKSLARSPHIRRASAPSCGGRIVALLLVTCLIADPVTSAAVSNTLAPGGRGRSPAATGVRGACTSENLFNEQVLAGRVGGASKKLLCQFKRISVRVFGTVSPLG